MGDDLFDTFAFFVLSFFAFIILCPAEGLLGGVILSAWWMLFLFLMGLSLWGTKKIVSKKIRLSGIILVILVFGAVFNTCYYLSVGEIAEAIVMGIMLNM